MINAFNRKRLTLADTNFWRAYQQESYTLLFWGCTFASVTFGFFWVFDAVVRDRGFFGGVLTIRFFLFSMYGILALLCWRRRHTVPDPRVATLWMNLFAATGIQITIFAAYMNRAHVNETEALWGVSVSAITATVVIFGLMKLSALNILALSVSGIVTAILYAQQFPSFSTSRSVMLRFTGHLIMAAIIGYVVRRQAEKKERLLFESQEANRIKERFLVSMSHDLRTPLHGILQLMTATAKDMSGGLRERMDMMADGAREMQASLNRILDYSAAAEGRIRAEDDRTDLEAVAEQLELLHKALAASKGIKLRIRRDIAPDARYVRCHGPKLREVFNNLLSNALKFTNEGGVSVELHARRTNGTKVHLVFKVRDTGIGIATKDRRFLFTPFWQADSRSTQGGTGLGLALSHEIVTKLFGGTINIESTQDIGTKATVEVKVLLADPPSATTPPPPAEPTAMPTESSLAVVAAPPPSSFLTYLAPSPSRPRPEGVEEVDRRDSVLALDGHILLAEDNAMNALGAHDILTAIGVRVDVAPDGVKAVQMFEAGSYDLVLMDIQMPNMDGFEASRRIRAMEARQPQRGRTPILAWTANHESVAGKDCASAGMDGLIKKGLDAAELPEVILQHLKLAARRAA